jgi:hypothetical protein
MGEPPLRCSCDLWPMWVQGAPPSAITQLTTIKCTDGTYTTKVQSPVTTCSYWRLGHKEGKERGYYNGVVHQMFRVNRADGTAVIIVAVN